MSDHNYHERNIFSEELNNLVYENVLDVWKTVETLTGTQGRYYQRPRVHVQSYKATKLQTTVESHI